MSQSIIPREFAFNTIHRDGMTCVCGNQPHSGGFYYCHRDGQWAALNWREYGEPGINEEFASDYDFRYVRCTDCYRILDMRDMVLNDNAEGDEEKYYLVPVIGRLGLPRLTQAQEDAWHNGYLTSNKVLETPSGLYMQTYFCTRHATEVIGGEPDMGTEGITFFEGECDVCHNFGTTWAVTQP